MCENCKIPKEYFDADRNIDWKRIHEETTSELEEERERGRKINKQLIFAGVLTPSKEGAWYFEEEKMNPYSLIPNEDDHSKAMGRVYFTEKKYAIAYGNAVWCDRLDNWVITNGVKECEIKKSDICK